MAKVTGPLLSVDASGKVADTIVFSRWRGIKYVRQWIKPANPNTAAQQTQRTRLADAIAAWVTLLGASAQQAWRDFQAGQERSGPNEFVSRHILAEAATKLIRYASVPLATPGVDQATITWTTDVACIGKVYYGTGHRVYSAEQAEGGADTSHSINVVGLVTGVKYYFFVAATLPDTQWAEGGELSCTPT